MDVDDDAQLPAHGAVAASHAVSAASVLARSDGTGDYVIRDFYDNDKKCLACNKKISCAGVDRLRFHLLPAAPTPLCPKLDDFPAIHGRALSREEVIDIVTALNEAAQARSRKQKRCRETSDRVEHTLNAPYAPLQVPADFRDSASGMDPKQRRLSVQDSYAAAATQEAAGDSYESYQMRQKIPEDENLDWVYPKENSLYFSRIPLSRLLFSHSSDSSI